MKWNFSIFNSFLILSALFFGSVFYITKVYYWEIIDVLVYPEFVFESVNLGKQSPSPLISIKLYIATYIQNSSFPFVDFIIERVGYDFYGPITTLFAAASVISLIYFFVEKKNYASILSVAICFLFFVLVVVLDSVPTKNEVDNDFSKFNYQDVTGLNYIKLLRKEKFSRLDEVWRSLEDKFHKGEITEQQYEFEFDKFEGIKREDLIYLERWISLSKRPEIPLSIRGNSYENLGWSERGNKFSKDTSEEQFMKMREYFRKAISDHSAALKLNNKMFFSYLSMLNISRASDLLYSNKVYTDALTYFPASLLLNYRYMVAIEPKWGGSLSEMSSHAESQRQHAIIEPKLVSLSGYRAVYKAENYWKNKDYSNAIKWYKRALLFGARSSLFKKINELYVIKKDYENANITLSEGLKIHPDNQYFLVGRAVNNVQLKNMDAAVIDANTAGGITIDKYLLMANLAWVYQQAGDNAKAVNFYIKALELNPDHVGSLHWLYYLSYLKAVSYKKVLPYMEHWISIKPNSSQAWISYANTVEDLNPLKAKHAYEKYLLFVDRRNASNLPYIKKVEAYLNKLDKHNR